MKCLKFPGILILLLLYGTIEAQYFGKNKPAYKTFDFNLLETPHFNIYHYFENPLQSEQLSQMAERWYRFHQHILVDTFSRPVPLIFYQNHADFQQTTAIMGYIDVGVAGVTEGLKNRIVMPLGFSQSQTNQVLGHEMVHAFQFRMLLENEGLGLSSMQNIPLWMIEGMAEYLSVGSIDSRTAMWMRDALIKNNFPSFEQLSDPGAYSPYRYGQSFWAYISYRYGEQFIPRLFKSTAKYGFNQALNDVLFISSDTLAAQWKRVLRCQLLRDINDSTFNIVGNRLITGKNGGRYNLCPSVSGDGKYLVFLSERDIYGLDLFLADAKSGQLIKKIYSSNRHAEIDAINYLETSGCWSPDNRFFAFVAYLKGKSVVVVYDVDKLKIHKEIFPSDVSAISYPAWSPDGRNIAFSGQNNGWSDLYIYNIETRECINLTKNNWCALQPAWTADSKKLLYVTDEQATAQTKIDPGFYNIAIINVETLHRKIFFTFDGAKNLNPVSFSDQDKVLFLSNHDGRRNLYLLDILTEEVFQITDYPTGITGLTDLSPAISIGGDCLFYTMLSDGEFQIISVSFDKMLTQLSLVPDRKTDYHAARLMPYSMNLSQVEINLTSQPAFEDEIVKDILPKKLKSIFQLDYIGNTGVGVMTGRFGGGIAGSVEALFSDILGRNILYTGININGQLYDFGGELAWLNQKRRLRIGAGYSHIPYRTGYYVYEANEDTGEEELVLYLRRIFEDKISFFTYFPLNRSKRVEAGIAYSLYNYSFEKIYNYYSYYPVYSGSSVTDQTPASFGVGTFDLAFVSDNSTFGITSPVSGHRLRLQGEHYFDRLNFNSLLFDYRKYFFIRPYSLAFRLYHYSRLGEDSDDDRLNLMFAGYPWYIRGYNTGRFYSPQTVKGGSVSVNQLLGSRLIVANIEWRVPFIGPMSFAWLKWKYFVSELAFFVDGAITWNSNSSPVWSFVSDSDTKRIPVFSAGVALRFNVFGVLVLEPYYALPFHQLKFKSGEVGFNILPGW